MRRLRRFRALDSPPSPPPSPPLSSPSSQSLARSFALRSTEKISQLQLDDHEFDPSCRRHTRFVEFYATNRRNAVVGKMSNFFCLLQSRENERKTQSRRCSNIFVAIQKLCKRAAFLSVQHTVGRTHRIIDVATAAVMNGGCILEYREQTRRHARAFVRWAAAHSMARRLGAQLKERARANVGRRRLEARRRAHILFSSFASSSSSSSTLRSESAELQCQNTSPPLRLRSRLHRLALQLVGVVVAASATAAAVAYVLLVVLSANCIGK